MGAALDFGMETAGKVVDAGMGLLLGKHHDKRQIRQQQKLQDMQIKGSKELTDYNYGKQLQMWKDTNYKQQMEQLRMAGLNPGLIYGMSGGGGQTTGSGSGASVSTGNAPVGGGEVQSIIGMGIQARLLEAQRRNIEANTEKTKAETSNVPLTGKNIEATTGLTNIQTEIAKLEQEIKGRSKEEAILGMQAAGRKLFDEAKITNVAANIAEDTQDLQMEKINAELIGTLLRNDQIKAQIGLTDEQTRSIAIKIAQEWKELDIKQQNADTQQKQYNLNRWMHNIKDSWRLAGDVVEGIVGGLLRRGMKTKRKETITSGTKGDQHTIETYK